VDRKRLGALTACALVLGFASAASGQEVGVVTPGGSSGSLASAAERYSIALAEAEAVETPLSAEVRQALRGEPAQSEGADALADVRRHVRASDGSDDASRLSRLGERLGLDALVTARPLGSEVELRVFDVQRGAFYRGTLVLPRQESSANREELVEFVQVRAAAAAGLGSESTEAETSSPRRRFWVWAIVGAAAAAIAAVALFATPDDTVSRDVGLRIDIP